MRADHHPDGPRRPTSTARNSSTATRRRFLAGGAGVLAGSVAAGLWTPTAAAAHSTEETTVVRPRYRNRVAWGAREELRLGEDGGAGYGLSFFPVQLITIHHTASWSPRSDQDAVGLVQAIYREHVQRHYGDIGYHLLIDPYGTVYEGRYSGGTSFPIYDNFPGWSVDRPRAVNAAHLYNYNAGNVGVALMGDCTSGNAVTWDAWDALVATVAHLALNAGLDPLGTTPYTNPISGVSQVLPTITCHREVAQTLCPGDAMVGWMPDLRIEVADMMNHITADGWFAS